MSPKREATQLRLDSDQVLQQVVMTLLRQPDLTRESSGAIHILQRYRARADFAATPAGVCSSKDELLHLRELSSRVAAIAAADTASATQEIFPPPDLSAVESCMRECLGKSRGHVANLKTIVGGYSKQTSMFDWIEIDGSTESYVLRRDCPPGIVGSSVTEEYPLLAALHRLGQPVPEPVYAGDRNPYIPNPFIITRKLPGHSFGGPLGPGDDREFDPTPGLAKALAGLHAVAVSDLAVPRFSDKAFDRGILSARIGYWRSRYLSGGENRSPTLDATVAFLEAEVDAGLQPGVVVHGDPGFYNLLFDDGDLIGIVDWELAHLGSAAWDLAYAKEGVEAFCPYEEFLRLYESFGGVRPNTRALAYYDVFRLFYSCTMCVNGISMFNRGESVGLDLLHVLYTMYPRYLEQLPLAMEAYRLEQGVVRQAG